MKTVAVLATALVACSRGRAEDPPAPAPAPPPAKTAPAPAVAPQAPADAPSPHARVVALVALEAPYGDIAAPEYISRFTADLHRAGPLVDCASAAACHADVIISGTLVHSSEGDWTEIELESVEVATSAHRTWHDKPLDSDQFFADAAARAYSALVP